MEEDKGSSGAKGGRLKKVLYFILRVGFAVGIIAFLLRGRAGDVLRNLQDFDYKYFVLAFVCYYIHFMFGAWRWHKLTAVLGIDLTLREACFLSMKAFFFSLVIPGGALGGDLVKLGVLASRTGSKGTRIEGAFTILMDRMTGMVSLFVLALCICVPAYPLLMRVDAPELYDLLGMSGDAALLRLAKNLVFAGIILMCLSGLGACVVLFMHRKIEKLPLISGLWVWADGRTRGAVSRMAGAMDLYRDKLPLLVNLTFWTTFLVHLNMVLIVYFILCGLHVSVTQLSLLTGVTLGDIAGLLPFTPSGIGFRDYTIIKLLELGGAAVDKAKAAALLFTALIIVSNISAGLFFIFDGRKRD